MDYSGIVPHAPVWRMERIPDFLSDDEIVKIQRVCDKKTSVGLRDYTILRVLGGLGLRASEIARLMLEDFDWTNGELIVHGKGLRISKMPLTQALGDVIVTYLLNGRPHCSSRSLFISAYPPFHGLISRSVSQIVARIFIRAGLKKKGKAHLLRHSFATKLINKGATLQQVGDVLRHQSIDTTAIYAKVDFKRLRPLALPWPGNLDFGGVL